MRSCIEWRKSFNFKQEVDEFNIYFRNKKEKLIKFLDQYAISQRVNLCIPIDITTNEEDLIIALWETGKYKLAVRFNWFSVEDNEETYEKMKKAGIPFYYSYMIDNWDELLGFCDLGVSDVFITGELGFDLKRVADVVHEKEINIRAYPNICQEGWDRGRNGVKSFFIRPEDVDIYSEFIDILEFYEAEDKQNSLYDIYFHMKSWDGHLQEIIYGLKRPLNSYYIMGDKFAERRISCQRKCLKGERCKTCHTLIELGEVIQNKPGIDLYKTGGIINGSRSIGERKDIPENS